MPTLQAHAAEVMDGKHTPGPWITGGFYIRGPQKELLARMRGAPSPEREANARLIAAAPDLLAALKTARECIVYCSRAHNDVQSGEGFPVELFIDAAIAKAEGRS